MHRQAYYKQSANYFEQKPASKHGKPSHSINNYSPTLVPSLEQLLKDMPNYMLLSQYWRTTVINASATVL